ncbi:MAG: hypothetical protein E7F55_11905, partial [Clostridium perfringens]|nr:hypothetical protein [Clostridium perfringens]
MKDSWIALIGLCSTLIGAGLGILGFTRTKKRDTREDTREAQVEATKQTLVETKLDYISKGIDDIRLDIKVQDRKIQDVIERVIRVEESTKSAHKRIDSIEEGV